MSQIVTPGTRLDALTVLFPAAPGRRDRAGVMLAMVGTLVGVVERDACPSPAGVHRALGWYEDWNDHYNKDSALAALPTETRRDAAQHLAVAALVVELGLAAVIEAGLATAEDAIAAGRRVQLALDAFAEAVRAKTA